MIISTKNIPLYYLITLLIAALLFVTSYYLDKETISNTVDITLKNRSIETPLKLWLNGFLGQFFHIKFVGTIACLSLIPYFYFLFSFRQLSNTYKAILIGYSFIALLLIFKGYFNYRYQLTLYPLNILVLFIFIANKIQSKSIKFNIHIIILILIISLSNINNYSILKKLVTRFNTQQSSQNKEVSISNNHTLTDIFTFIDTVKTNQSFLVNDLSMFYYNTNKKGLYFWAERDIYFDKQGPNNKLQNKTSNEYKNYIKDSLQCEYVFSCERYNLLSQKFSKFLLQDCKLVFQANDQGNVYLIHKVQ
jgi:hypothetical protein